MTTPCFDQIMPGQLVKFDFDPLTDRDPNANLSVDIVEWVDSVHAGRQPRWRRWSSAWSSAHMNEKRRAEKHLGIVLAKASFEELYHRFTFELQRFSWRMPDGPVLLIALLSPNPLGFILVADEYPYVFLETV